MLAALRAKGIDDITVSEPAPVRQALARRLGAVEVIGPDDLPTLHATPARSAPDGFHVVFEASGIAGPRNRRWPRCAAAAPSMLVGAGPGQPRWSASRILLNEIWVSGSFVYDDGGFEDALALLAAGRIPVDLLTEPDDVPLNGLLEAIHELATGRVAGKVLVVPEVR